MIVVEISMRVKDVPAWRKMVTHLGDTHGWADPYRQTVRTVLVQEELKKYNAEYDPVLLEVLFPEEKYYTMWQLRWG